MSIARFCATYPGMYRGWPQTRRCGFWGGVVPWQVFVRLMVARPAVLAEQRLQTTRATSIAIANAMNGDDPKVVQQVRKDQQEAYPA